LSDVDPDPEEDLDADGDADADGEVDREPEEGDGRKYALRQRAKINYAIPPPLEKMSKPPPKPARGRGKHELGGGGGGARGGVKGRGPRWSVTGAELGRWVGMGGDDSVHDLLLLWAVVDLTFSRTRTTLHGHPGSRLVRVLVRASLVGLLRVVVEGCYLGILLLLECRRI
jgi:hypothetical protein